MARKKTRKLGKDYHTVANAVDVTDEQDLLMKFDLMINRRFPEERDGPIESKVKKGKKDSTHLIWYNATAVTARRDVHKTWSKLKKHLQDLGDNTSVVEHNGMLAAPAPKKRRTTRRKRRS